LGGRLLLPETKERRSRGVGDNDRRAAFRKCSAKNPSREAIADLRRELARVAADWVGSALSLATTQGAGQRSGTSSVPTSALNANEPR
jgi:hypothetical protein